jgi:hypothetical protein
MRGKRFIVEKCLASTASRWFQNNAANAWQRACFPNTPSPVLLSFRETSIMHSLVKSVGNWGHQIMFPGQNTMCDVSMSPVEIGRSLRYLSAYNRYVATGQNSSRMVSSIRTAADAVPAALQEPILLHVYSVDVVSLDEQLLRASAQRLMGC